MSMEQSIKRNQSCPCGSGLRYKKCCGSAETLFKPIDLLYPLNNTLGIERCADLQTASPYEREIVDLLQKGNIPQALIALRALFGDDENNPRRLNFLGWIASAVGLPDIARGIFSRSLENSENFDLPRRNLDELAQQRRQLGSDFSQSESQLKSTSYLYVKPWGFGFWSDVSCLISQFLICEITNRQPVIEWLSGSLFRNDEDQNSFNCFFENTYAEGLFNFAGVEGGIWPPKWTIDNIYETEINKWDGQFSRMAAVFFLDRKEEVLVSDFYTYVPDIIPFIPKNSPLYGKTADELILFIVEKYLKPKQTIKDKVNQFIDEKLKGAPYISVHARGSDKIQESKISDSINDENISIVKEMMDSHPSHKLFLMSDDARIINLYDQMFGGRLVYTDSQRASNEIGVHYNEELDGVQLGVEVMVDAYIAASGEKFVGNGKSNVSIMVRYLKDWALEDVFLTGGNSFLEPNGFLYRR